MCPDRPVPQTGLVRKLVIALVVLVVLLLAADFGARALAESRVGTEVQARGRLTAAPDVSIEGFPFLLHALQGEYPEVVLTTADVAGDVVPGTRVQLTLSSLRVPIGDALSGNTENATAQSSTTEVLIPATALSAALGRPDLVWSAGADGDPTVSTTVDLLGQQIPVSGTADVTVSNNTLTLAVQNLTAAGIDVTPALSAAASAVASTLVLSVPLGTLPVEVTGGTVTVSGPNVVLTATTGPIRFADLV